MQDTYEIINYAGTYPSGKNIIQSSVKSADLNFCYLSQPPSLPNNCIFDNG